jgi:hypothetical protein
MSGYRQRKLRALIPPASISNSSSRYLSLAKWLCGEAYCSFGRVCHPERKCDAVHATLHARQFKLRAYLDFHCCHAMTLRLVDARHDECDWKNSQALTCLDAERPQKGFQTRSNSVDCTLAFRPDSSKWLMARQCC